MKVKSDIEIAREAKKLPIKEVAKKLGIEEEELIPYVGCSPGTLASVSFY